METDTIKTLAAIAEAFERTERWLFNMRKKHKSLQKIIRKRFGIYEASRSEVQSWIERYGSK